ncbi:hypothetical protein Tco_0842983 [Tanacetum coccineum]|uniref:Uncharacterized protein n=1 Tax=Tanacetum coccineum TaxID=301880 RepID=A0ABQ5B4W8_9ASTR
MTAKDVKSLSLRHGIPLDLHPVALTTGWTMDKLPDDMIGLYEQYFEFSEIRVPFSAFLLAVIKHFLSKQGHWFSFEKRVGKGAGGQIFRETFSRLKGWKKSFFFLDRRAIPDAMAWRHHDSDINDPALKDGFSVQDVQTLVKRAIDLRPIPSGLLFQGGLATTWDFPGFRPIFKDTEGNVVTMSEYLRFPLMSGATIEKGTALTNQDLRGQHIVPPLPADQAISDKTDHQREAEVEDPKIVAIRERKARAAAKKREKKKREPLRIVNPTETGGENPSGAAAATAKSREDCSLRTSYDSANHSVHDSADAHGDEGMNTRRLGPLVDQSGGNLATVQNEVFQPSPGNHSVHPSPTDVRTDSPTRSALRGNVEEGESSRHQAYYVPEWAWFALGRGALAQADMLGRFKNLQANYDKLAETHTECENTVRQLVDARAASQQNSRIYLEISKRFKKLKNGHAGCTEKIQLLEDWNSELS